MEVLGVDVTRRGPRWEGGLWGGKTGCFCGGWVFVWFSLEVLTGGMFGDFKNVFFLVFERSELGESFKTQLFSSLLSFSAWHPRDWAFLSKPH